MNELPSLAEIRAPSFIEAELDLKEAGMPVQANLPDSADELGPDLEDKGPGAAGLERLMESTPPAIEESDEPEVPRNALILDDPNPADNNGTLH